MTSRVRPIRVEACFALCSSFSCLHFNNFAVEVVVVIFIEVLIHACFENVYLNLNFSSFSCFMLAHCESVPFPRCKLVVLKTEEM